MDKEKVLNIIKEIVAKIDYKVEDHGDGYLSVIKSEEQQLVAFTRTVNTQTLLLFYTNVSLLDVGKLTDEHIKKINQINAEIASKLFVTDADAESISHVLNLRQELFAFSEEQLQSSIPTVIENLFSDVAYCLKELEATF